MATSTVNKKRAFLQAYIACADLTRAAKGCKMDRSVHYDWLRKDPEYAKAYEQARIEAGQTLEDSAADWALRGIEEPIVYQGQFQYKQRLVQLFMLPDGREVRRSELPKGDLSDLAIVSSRWIEENYGTPITIRRRSEGLHARLLKAFIPERYGDKVQTELTGKDGGPVRVTDERLKNLTDEQLLTLIEISRQLTGDRGDGSGTQTPPAE